MLVVCLLLYCGVFMCQEDDLRVTPWKKKKKSGHYWKRFIKNIYSVSMVERLQWSRAADTKVFWIQERCKSTKHKTTHGQKAVQATVVPNEKKKKKKKNMYWRLTFQAVHYDLNLRFPSGNSNILFTYSPGMRKCWIYQNITLVEEWLAFFTCTLLHIYSYR